MSLVANSLSVRFIISQVFAHVMASGATLVCIFNSLGTLVEIDAPPFIAVCGSEVLLLSQDSSVKTFNLLSQDSIVGTHILVYQDSSVGTLNLLSQDSSVGTLSLLSQD